MSLKPFFAAAALCLAGISQASLVTNGSFESGLIGWACNTNVGSGGCFSGNQGDPAADGFSYFFGYENTAPGGTLSQALATVAGSLYNISLFFNTNGTVPPNELTLSVGSLSLSLALMPGS